LQRKRGTVHNDKEEKRMQSAKGYGMQTHLQCTGNLLYECKIHSMCTENAQVLQQIYLLYSTG
jgi:hypothetical protein